MKGLLSWYFFYFLIKERFMITKIIVFILFMAIMNVAKEGTLFGIALRNETKFNITNNRLLFLASSIAYILTIIFTGIAI